MIHVLVLLAGTFLTAYGNAMRRVTWRRRDAVEHTATASANGTGAVYDLSGLILFNLGLLVLAAWVLWVVGAFDLLARVLS